MERIQRPLLDFEWINIGLLGSIVMRCVGSATAVLVGCFSAEAAIPGRPICEASMVSAA